MWDTDSFPIGVDNRCTACISNSIDDFKVPLQDTDRTIRGFGGTTHTGIKRGTLKCSIADDQGKTYHFIIPKSYYVPAGGVRLLSPQHWAKQYKNKTKKMAKSTTYYENVVLEWNDNKCKLTIPLDDITNVATINSSPGYGKFHAFCTEINLNRDEDMLQNNNDNKESIKSICKCKTSKGEFNLEGENESMQTHYRSPEEKLTVEAEFLRIHQKLGHISPKCIQQMAKMGMSPSRLAKCQIPKCSACLYGKATKCPWRSKVPRNQIKDPPPSIPGQLIYIDQLISPTPGLIAQMTGKPTVLRYTCATIFVDHVSDLTFIHLQKSTAATETVQGKREFEQLASENGHKIKAYHADNGIFNSAEWRESCHENEPQTLTFAGVNAHHQNGVAERRIQDIHTLSRTSLIHTNKRCPTAITNNLWPYAMRMVVHVLNNTPSFKLEGIQSPMKKFSDSQVHINLKHFYHFGCPTYVLERPLQTNVQIFHKWKARSRMGIYLGHSKQHAKSVALVLSLETGLVSPQFHVKMDPSSKLSKRINLHRQIGK